MAKSRIAPKRKLSIPRLELLATVIGIRGINFVESQLRLKISERIMWTDSKCVLHWIKSRKPLSVFVENRVKEIRNHKNVVVRYVKTTDNPADIATKPQTTDDLKENSLWWEGPKWLSTPQNNWPKWDFEPITNEEAKRISEEVRGTNVLYEAGMACPSADLPTYGVFTIDDSKFSNLLRLLRVTAWVHRFLRKLKPMLYPKCSEGSNMAQQGPLTAEELTEAKLLWEQNQQERYFKDLIAGTESEKMINLKRQLGIQVDKQGILRCYGRLCYADLNETAKFPKLLPKQGKFTELTIQYYHKSLLHSGVSHTLAQLRTEYWIPQGRSVVRKVLSRCLTCRKEACGPFRTPPIPPLPLSRVNPTPPFQVTGLDYFGPLYIKSHDGVSKKVWICLFTCLCVRAVHLELADDMSGEQFLLALRKFIARRGCPKHLISDNAPQFKASNSVLRRLKAAPVKDGNFESFLSNKGIIWKFIPEFAPWMGGFYERLIGIVKKNLKKTIGLQRLTGPQLNTTLAEVESVVNSRPLVYVDSDFSSLTVLSPADFLCINPHRILHSLDYNTTDDPNYDNYNNPANRLGQYWIKGQKLLQSFWDIWTKDYLLSLRERHQSTLKAPRVTTPSAPKIGQVVLIKDGQTPRGTWKTGRIIQLLPSSDGQCRSVKLQTPNRRTLVRPIRNLFPLELPVENADTVPLADISRSNSPPRCPTDPDGLQIRCSSPEPQPTSRTGRRISDISNCEPESEWNDTSSNAKANGTYGTSQEISENTQDDARKTSTLQHRRFGKSNTPNTKATDAGQELNGKVKRLAFLHAKDKLKEILLEDSDF